MKRFTFLLALFALFGLQVGFAQNIKLQGTVTNAADGKVLPGVTVMAKGYSGIGTITNDKAILYHRVFLIQLNQCPIIRAAGILIRSVDINDLEKKRKMNYKK